MLPSFTSLQRPTCLSIWHAKRLGQTCVHVGRGPATTLCRAKYGQQQKNYREQLEEAAKKLNIRTNLSVEAPSSNSSEQDDLEDGGWMVDIRDLDEDSNIDAAFGDEGNGMQGADYVEAEDLSIKALRSLPRHQQRQWERMQMEADEEAAKLKKASTRQKAHQKLRVISGSAAGRRLTSPQGRQTRPMMAVVRGAVFSMLMSTYGYPGQLPQKTRWLDLYAGTGAVGIEALSRGCGQCHFVELSPWVVNNCLVPNLETCDVESSAVVHTMRAEDFLQKSLTLSRFGGGAFDFISVCPPYLLVSYEELFDLLEDSPLLHKESMVIMEYPKQFSHLIRNTLGPLEKLKDRRYGRTLVAVFGPAGGYSSEEEDE